MSLAYKILILLCLPAIVLAQAIDQRKVGLYIANKAGTDCSQATLAAADDAALAAGQVLVLPPSDRFGAVCQWVVSGDLTIDSPLLIPYDDTPVLKVNQNITLTLQDCPYTWGNYGIIDADESTTGSVGYVAACTDCTFSGPGNPIICTGSGGGGGATQLSQLSDVNVSANAADNEILLGDGSQYQGIPMVGCNSVSEKLHYDTATNTFSCETDGGGVADLSSITDVNADADAQDNEIILGDGSEYRGVSLASCNIVSEKLHYDSSTNSFSCGTDGGGLSILSNLTNVNADANATDDEVILGDGVEYRGVNMPSCDTVSGKLHYDTATNTFSCETDGSGVAALSGLTNVNADADNTDDEVILGDGTEYRGVGMAACNAVTGKLHYDADTNAFSCETDASGGTTALDVAFDTQADGTIDSALCGTKEFTISNAGDDFWERCVDSGGIPKDIATCDGAACDITWAIPANRDLIIHDVEAALDFFIIDPDATAPNLKYRFLTGYEPLVSTEVVLRPLGDCSVAEEAIVANDPVDDWITCADTTGDAVTFNYKVTSKIASDTTINIKMFAVNKNGSPSGTFSLQCAAQSIRPGIDSYQAHNTAGQSTLSFNTFDTSNRLESSEATFTVNGTVAVGAHIKGQCNVSATPAQIADIRLSGTAIVELFANSLSD